MLDWYYLQVEHSRVLTKNSRIRTSMDRTGIGKVFRYCASVLVPSILKSLILHALSNSLLSTHQEIPAHLPYSSMSLIHRLTDLIQHHHRKTHLLRHLDLGHSGTKSFSGKQQEQ